MLVSLYALRPIQRVVSMSSPRSLPPGWRRFYRWRRLSHFYEQGMPDLNSETPPATEPLAAEKPVAPHAFYHTLDRLSGMLILVAAVVAPWLFGTGDTWAVTLMTVMGCSIGLLLAAKRGYCRLKSYTPPRWGDPNDQG